jgi:hypothetical protein
VGNGGSTYRLKPISKRWVLLRIVALLCGLFLLVVAVQMATTPGHPGTYTCVEGGTCNYSRTSNVIGGSILFVCALFVFWSVFHRQFRPRIVSVTPTELRSRGDLGFTERVARSDIASIDLREHNYIGWGPPVKVPYVTRRNGEGFWLHALAGASATMPTDPTQLKMLKELCAAVGVSPSL